jgi:Glycosyl-hydrolase 97 N-terminal
VRLLLALAFILPVAPAQDLRRITSPSGQIEFRLFISQPEDGALFRLGYQVSYRGKLLLDTSYLGLEIQNQEPVLGENVGLTASRSSDGGPYHSLVAEYMQNGSIGRRITIEVRVWDDRVAFRYVIPRSTALQEILIDNETTEFHFAQSFDAPKSRAALPFVTQQPGIGRVTIAESGAPDYPRSELEPGRTILVTRLTRPFEGTTPLTCPWRTILIEPTSPAGR